MSTQRQKNVAVKLVVNGGKDKPQPLHEIMTESGYSDAIAHNPQKVIESKGVQQELEPLLQANNITQEQYLTNLGMGMVAMKQNQFTGEIDPDIGMRLKANKEAERFLHLKTPEATDTANLIKITPTMDEVELTRAVFRRT